MKLILTACLIAVAGLPAAAFDRMLRSDCQLSVERLFEMVQSDAQTTAALSHAIHVTPQGWCVLHGGAPGLENAEFDTFEWRMDETSRWTRDGIAPLALEMRVMGARPDNRQGDSDTRRPDLEIEVLLRQLPDAGMIVVERAVMSNGAGDSLSLSGVFERVFLSSPSMMQVSMGSAVFKAGLMSMTLEGTHENPFGFKIDVEMQGAPQAQRDAAFEMVSKLPDGVIDDASRAELTAFAGDLPKPVGTLDVSVASERGLGVVQIALSSYRSVTSVIDGESGGGELELLLDGITVEADWTPAAQVAD